MPVACVPMPVARVAVDARAVSALRARLGFDASHLVVGVFGLLTPEKRPLRRGACAGARGSGRIPGCACCW